MMIGEYQAGPAFGPQGATDHPPHVQLVFEPQRNRQAKALESHRRIGQVGFQKSLELCKRFVVKGDVIDLGWRQIRFLKTVGDSLARKGRVMFDAREPFFLSSGRDPAVHHQSGRAVMIKCGDSQDRSHACSRCVSLLRTVKTVRRSAKIQQGATPAKCIAGRFPP